MTQSSFSIHQPLVGLYLNQTLIQSLQGYPIQGYEVIDQEHSLSSTGTFPAHFMPSMKCPFPKQLTELNSSYPNMLLSIGQSRLRRWRYYEHQLSFGEQERTLSLSQELMKRNRYTHVSCVHPCQLSSTLSLGL